VLAYLVGDRCQMKLSRFNVVRENPVELEITREKSSIGEKPDHNFVTKKYRELGENPEGLLSEYCLLLFLFNHFNLFIISKSINMV
jgi:hypothetical protein